MTPRQALLWFVAILIIVGILVGAGASLFRAYNLLGYGIGLAVVGAILGLFVKKIKWS